MISQVGVPSLALFIATPSFREVTRESREADCDPQSLALSLGPSGAPRVLAGEALNKFAKFWRDGRASGSLLRERTPVPPKALTVPSDHGFGLYDDWTGLPSGPESEEGEPKGSIQRG